jgi:ABC-type Zn uptake system ZnuABC Zn-binding protein ZnuA
MIFCIVSFGCTAKQDSAQVAATTLPVYEFTVRLCEGTDIEVERLVTESVSCLHDYTLKTNQMRAIENAQIIVVSGAGLEDFLDGALDHAQTIIDASSGITLMSPEETDNHNEHHAHTHEYDPHIWLSPVNAIAMAKNISVGLITAYPEYESIIANNLKELITDLEKLSLYASAQLQNLSHREIITFHDGFSYMADAFNLNIVHAIEEESGSEASAAELIDLIQIISDNDINAIFTEQNGSTSAAEIIAAETGANIFKLDMAMAGDSYFDAMYHNIDTLKEALK